MQGFNDIPESFILGDTHTYNASFLPKPVYEYLARGLEELQTDSDKEEHFPLSCGILTEVQKKPVIAAYAAAFRGDGDATHAIYISLTVHALPGFENDAERLGVKRVAIFSRGMEGNILQRLLDVVNDDPDSSAMKRRIAMNPGGVVASPKYTLFDISSDNPSFSNSHSRRDDNPFVSSYLVNVFISMMTGECVFA